MSDLSVSEGENMEINKKVIKNQINDFCLDLYGQMGQEAAIGNTPISILIYLGEESFKILNEEMKEAFSSMLNIRPVMKPIVLEGTQGNEKSLRQELEKVIEELNEQGHLIRGAAIRINLSFLSLMHDKVFEKVNAEESIHSIKGELKRMEEYGVSFSDIAFYGIFDQRKNEENYEKVFGYLSVGDPDEIDIWKKVFHLEKAFYADTYETECRAVAMHILKGIMFPNSYGAMKAISNQNNELNDYIWYSLGLDEMKIPEQMICNMLITAYGKQFVANQMRDSQMRRFEAELQRTILEHVEETCDIFRYKKMMDYLPLRAVNDPDESSQRKFVLFKSKEKTRKVPCTGLILDEKAIESIFSDYLKQYKAEMYDDEKIVRMLEKVLGVFETVDSTPQRMATTILQSVQMVKNDLEHRANSLPTITEETNFEYYCQQLFEYYSIKKKYECAASVLSGCQTEHFKNAIIDMLNELKQDNSKLIRILDELRVNQYGGTAELNLPVLTEEFEISLNDSVASACKKIQPTVLDSLLMDKTLIQNNMKVFMTRAQNNAETRNAIGRIYQGHNITSTIDYELLSNVEVGTTGIKVQTGSMFRNNTLQMISTCEWKSKCNLRGYYKGEK